MPGTAIALNLVFLILAVGWRGYVQYRRTRDMGFRKPAPSAAPLEKIAGAALALGLIGLLLAPVCTVLGLCPPLGAMDRPAIHLAGLVLACSGIALTVLAEFEMGDSWRVGVDPEETTSLVTHGVFRHIRNPIYAGMLLYALGLLGLVPSLAALVAVLVVVLGIELQVRGVEEPYLVRRHGETYSAYARGAGRFFPWLGRLS